MLPTACFNTVVFWACWLFPTNATHMFCLKASACSVPSTCNSLPLISAWLISLLDERRSLIRYTFKEVIYTYLRSKIGVPIMLCSCPIFCTRYLTPNLLYDSVFVSLTGVISTEADFLGCIRYWVLSCWKSESNEHLGSKEIGPRIYQCGIR